MAWLHRLQQWLPTVLQIGVGAAVGYNINALSVVEGVSMYPTLEPGQRLLHAPLWVKELFSPLSAGDVVLARVDPSTTVCKRVVAVGTPDQRLQWEDVRFTDEETGFDSARRFMNEAWAPCQHAHPNSSTWLWLEGDNSANSFDSREAGAVPVECVKGVVAAVVWPVADWRRVL